MKSVGCWPVHPPIMLNLRNFHSYFTPFTHLPHLLRFMVVSMAPKLHAERMRTHVR